MWKEGKGMEEGLTGLTIKLKDVVMVRFLTGKLIVVSCQALIMSYVWICGYMLVLLAL